MRRTTRCGAWKTSREKQGRGRQEAALWCLSQGALRGSWPLSQQRFGCGLLTIYEAFSCLFIPKSPPYFLKDHLKSPRSRPREARTSELRLHTEAPLRQRPLRTPQRLQTRPPPASSAPLRLPQPPTGPLSPLRSLPAPLPQGRALPALPPGPLGLCWAAQLQHPPGPLPSAPRRLRSARPPQAPPPSGPCPAGPRHKKTALRCFYNTTKPFSAQIPGFYRPPNTQTNSK